MDTPSSTDKQSPSRRYQFDLVGDAALPPVTRHKDLACNLDNARWFYPPPTVKDSAGNGKYRYTEARKICMSCNHIKECLFDALETKQQRGFWGGATPDQRRKMLREGWRPRLP